MILCSNLIVWFGVARVAHVAVRRRPGDRSSDRPGVPQQLQQPTNHQPGGTGGGEGYRAHSTAKAGTMLAGASLANTTNTHPHPTIVLLLVTHST